MEILAKAEHKYITQQAQVKHWTRLLQQFDILQCSVVINAKKHLCDIVKIANIQVMSMKAGPGQREVF